MYHMPRMPPPRGRGYPIGYPPDFNSFLPSETTRGSSSHQNIHPETARGNQKHYTKKKRSKQRNQNYMVYSDNESVRSTSSNNYPERHQRGGIVNAAIRNLPQTNRWPNPNSRNKTSVPINQASSSYYQTDTESKRNYNSPDSQIKNKCKKKIEEQCDISDAKMYSCPKCRENYTFRQTNSKYIGKFPLVLHCNHTVCQECVYQSLVNNKINCPVCHTDSALSQEESPVCQTNLQNIFSPNYYIIGVITYGNSTGGYLKNLENIKFVTPGKGVKKTEFKLPPPSERCRYGLCPKEVTKYCPSCEELFCTDCCIVVHKSTKKLMSHEPVLHRRQKFSILLEDCSEHSTMQAEFFCMDCEVTACCYCILDKHSDHKRVPMFSLNDKEMEEFKELKKEAVKALKGVITSQKQIAKVSSFSTNTIKKEVCQYFGDYHAKISAIEKRLCDELDKYQNSNSDLHNIQATLMQSAEQLKALVTFNENTIDKKKLNLRGALERLRNVKNLPRFLLNENDVTEPVRFVVNPHAFDSLNTDFMIEKCQEAEYRLVAETDLPEDYIDVGETDSEVDETISALMEQSLKTEDEVTHSSRKNIIPTLGLVSSISKAGLSHRKMDMERVEVQHINSMDSFYVQYKNDQSKLTQLNQDIQNYIKMGGAQLVDHPELNNIYLAQYIVESNVNKEHRWCRARLKEIKNGPDGPMYEVFFIDYGKSQVINGNRIKDIPSYLVQKKVFAVECMLGNPMSLKWNKRAHVQMANIINGKDLYMIKKSFNAGIYEVDLMIASSDGGFASVIDILVHATNSVASINDDTLSAEGSISFVQEGFYQQLRVFPNSKVFEKHQKEKVTIANVVDPHNMFVHLQSQQESFKTMCKSIKKAIKSGKIGACVPVEGTYVLVQYKDPVRLNWHRALIKNVDLTCDNIYVLLVDWGINVVVSSSDVRAITESFTKLESQAVLVKLAHVAPFNTSSTWSSQACQFFQCYHRSQEVLKMIVHETDPDLEVALFEMSGPAELCLNAMMVQNNLADSTGSISIKKIWPQFEADTPKFSEDEGLIPSLLKKADQQDESDDEDLKNVKKLEVTVVRVDGPDQIYVKFAEFKKRENQLYKELQIHHSEEQKTKKFWKKNEHCVVELSGEYLRGQVLEDSTGECKVYLYDKAQEVTAPINKLYIIEKYFLTKPQAVTRSHLANIRPAGDTGKWSSGSIEVLQEIFSKHKRIYANRARETDVELAKKSLPLDMWFGVIICGGPLDPDTIKYTSINKFLVKLGFAYKMSIPGPKTVKTGEELLKSLLIEENKIDNSEEIKDFPENMNENCRSTKENPDISKENLKKTTNKLEKKFKDPQMVEEEPAPGVKASNNKSKDCASESHVNKTEKSDEDATNWNSIIEQEEANIIPKTLEMYHKKLTPENERTPKKDEDSPNHKIKVVIDNWLPSFRLTQQDFKARVTCVEAGYLYLHEEAMDPLYYKMEANIREYFENDSQEPSKMTWKPGHLCTIQYDGVWYRGQVLKVISPEEISVFMIDFGSDHIVSPKLLFEEIVYTDISAFATKVKLDKVYSKSGSWLSSDYDNFHDLVTDWCRIVVNGPLDVETPLVDVYNDEGVYVNQKLVEQCPNLSRCSNFPTNDGDEEEECIVIESIEEGNSVGDEVIKVLLDEVYGELDNRMWSIIDMTNMQYRMQALPDEFFENKMVLLELGGVISYNKVALKQPDATVSEEIYDLIISIQDAVDSLPQVKEIKLGLPCLAPFSEDGIWYRARICSIDALESGAVGVFFVDYGNSEQVSINRIKQVRPDYFDLPQQTWEAKLNIVLTENTDPAAVHLSMVDALQRKRVSVKMIKEIPLTVDLYDETDLCYQTLIDDKLVTPCHKEEKNT